MLKENRLVFHKFPSIWAKSLNTFKLETWTSPYQDKDSFFDSSKRKIDWEYFDIGWYINWNTKEDTWERAWGKKCNPNIVLIIENADWTNRLMAIPSIIIWWMWTWVSSKSLIKAAWEIWIWWHLSSIWIWGSYEAPNVYQKWEWFEKAFEEVENKFYSIFRDKFWLSENKINKHFFECNEWLDENFWITESRKEKMFRMKDLIAIYEQISDILSSSKTPFWINAMYKTTSYVAVLKVSTLAWIDFITTAAWFPNINPKIIIWNFLNDIWRQDIVMPALWLITTFSRIVTDLNYDYYIIEDARFAWWHLWWTDEMLDKPNIVWKYENLISLRKKVWEWKPILLAWWFDSRKSIQEGFDAWANWIQFATQAAVSDEAVNWKWDDFKNLLISWNHIWPKKEIDNIAETEYIELKKWLKNTIQETREKIFNLNSEQILEPQVLKVLKYIHKIVFWNFYKWKILEDNFWNEDISELEWEDLILFNKIWSFFESKIQDEIQINEEFRKYWNMLKLAEQFIKFDNLWIIPTHIVFDSVVWFDARKRLWKSDWKLCSEIIKTRACVWCLNSCLLAQRWKKWAPKQISSTPFCIVDWLEQWNHRREIPIYFSWTTSVPYPEIRPIRDIIAAMMWIEVIR